MKKTMFALVALFSLSCAGPAFSEQRIRPVLEFTSVIPQPAPQYNFEVFARRWMDYDGKLPAIVLIDRTCQHSHARPLFNGGYIGDGILFDYKWVNDLFELYGSDENFSNVTTPERVELVKIIPREDGYDEKVVFSDQIPGQLAPVDTARLQYWLSTDSALEWWWWDDPFEYDLDLDELLASPGTYEYRVKFWRNGKAVCVDFDFTNRQLQVLVDGKAMGRTGLGTAYGYLRQVVEFYFPELLLKDEDRCRWNINRFW